MSGVVNYWTFYKLNAQGKVIPEEITQAKIFILQQYPDTENQNTYSNAVIQRHLFALFRQNDAIAEICLRCFISQQITQVCIDLESKFGNSHQFNRYDLFPFVLDDFLHRPTQPQTGEYTPIATKILQTFDPEKSSLSTWTTRLVKYEPTLNQFLNECGINRISDWAILNDTNSQKLHRILKEVYYFDEVKITDAIALLQAYHAIYRQERLANRKAGIRSKCSEPTLDQLQKMAQLIKSSRTPQQILKELQDLAEKLCRPRSIIAQDSLEYPEIQARVEQQQISELSDDSEQEAQEFLRRYRQQFLSCLERAIASIVRQWLNKQQEPKKQQFLDALKLFHCQGLSMTEIASALGLQRQYQVTRLIQLKNLRSDIQQQMLNDLRQEIIEIASIYTDPEQLLKQEKQIEIALAANISIVFEEAQAEASKVKGQPLKSIFAQYICRYLHL